MRGWGNLFFALVDANGPLICFALLMTCILVVTEVYVNMISAILANNFREVAVGEMKEKIAMRFPGFLLSMFTTCRLCSSSDMLYRDKGDNI